MTGAVLLAWLKLLALDGALAKAEPKTLRYRVRHAAARLVPRRPPTTTQNPPNVALASQIEQAWQRITALPQAP